MTFPLILALSLGLAATGLIGLVWLARVQRGGAGWAVRLGFPVATFRSGVPIEMAAQTSRTARFHTLERDGRWVIVENHAYADPNDRLRSRAGQDLLVGEVSPTGRSITFRTALPSTLLWIAFLLGAAYFGVLAAGGELAGDEPSGLALGKHVLVGALVIGVPILTVRRARRRARSFAKALGFRI